MDIDADKLARSPLFIGALGAVMALKFTPGLSWPERAFNVLCGALSAAYCAPALGEWVAATTAGRQAALAFVVGVFGLSFAAAVVQGLRDIKLSEVISGWISRRG